jgi:hypothetical protein
MRVQFTCDWRPHGYNFNVTGQWPPVACYFCMRLAAGTVQGRQFFENMPKAQLFELKNEETILRDTCIGHTGIHQHYAWPDPISWDSFFKSNLTVFDEGVIPLDELPGLVQQDLHARGLVLVAQLRLQIPILKGTYRNNFNMVTGVRIWFT